MKIDISKTIRVCAAISISPILMGQDIAVAQSVKWEHHCTDERCKVGAFAHDPSVPNSVFGIVFERDPRSFSHRLVKAYAPLGSSLEKGISIILDDEPLATAAFDSCGTNGCTVELRIDAETFVRFFRSNEVAVSFWDADGKTPFIGRLNLQSFSEAINGAKLGYEAHPDISPVIMAAFGNIEKLSTTSLSFRSELVSLYGETRQDLVICPAPIASWAFKDPVGFRGLTDQLNFIINKKRDSSVDNSGSLNTKLLAQNGYGLPNDFTEYYLNLPNGVKVYQNFDSFGDTAIDLAVSKYIQSIDPDDVEISDDFSERFSLSSLARNAFRDCDFSGFDSVSSVPSNRQLTYSRIHKLLNRAFTEGSVSIYEQAALNPDMSSQDTAGLGDNRMLDVISEAALQKRLAAKYGIVISGRIPNE